MAHPVAGEPWHCDPGMGGPEPLLQSLAGDHFAGPLQEHGQHADRLTAELNPNAVFSQIALLGMELERSKPEALRGGDADANATALMAVLKGTKGPFRDIAVLNAAAALVVAGRAKDLKEGAALAKRSIDSGEAEGRLDRLIAVSNAQ